MTAAILWRLIRNLLKNHISNEQDFNTDFLCLFLFACCISQLCKPVWKGDCAETVLHVAVFGFFLSFLAHSLLHSAINEYPTWEIKCGMEYCRRVDRNEWGIWTVPWLEVILHAYLLLSELKINSCLRIKIIYLSLQSWTKPAGRNCYHTVFAHVSTHRRLKNVESPSLPPD